MSTTVTQIIVMGAFSVCLFVQSSIWLAACLISFSCNKSNCPEYTALESISLSRVEHKNCDFYWSTLCNNAFHWSTFVKMPFIGQHCVTMPLIGQYCQEKTLSSMAKAKHCPHIRCVHIDI